MPSEFLPWNAVIGAVLGGLIVYAAWEQARRVARTEASEVLQAKLIEQVKAVEVDLAGIADLLATPASDADAFARAVSGAEAGAELDIGILAGQANADIGKLKNEPAKPGSAAAKLQAVATAESDVTQLTSLAAAGPSALLNPRDLVTAGAAWTAHDSWVTNVTAGSSTLSGAVAALGGQHYLGLLLLVFGLAALSGPVVYAAFAAGKTQTTGVTGTIAGYLLAGWVVLFGVLGELSALALNGGKNLPFWAPICFAVAAAAALCFYSIRTMTNVLVTQTQPRKPPPAAAMAKVRFRAGAPAAKRPASLLVGAVGYRSATL